MKSRRVQMLHYPFATQKRLASCLTSKRLASCLTSDLSMQGSTRDAEVSQTSCAYAQSSLHGCSGVVSAQNNLELAGVDRLQVLRSKGLQVRWLVVLGTAPHLLPSQTESKNADSLGSRVSSRPSVAVLILFWIA